MIINEPFRKYEGKIVVCYFHSGLSACISFIINMKYKTRLISKAQNKIKQENNRMIYMYCNLLGHFSLSLRFINRDFANF